MVPKMNEIASLRSPVCTKFRRRQAMTFQIDNFAIPKQKSNMTQAAEAYKPKIISEL
jgi:hypothetical protein